MTDSRIEALQRQLMAIRTTIEAVGQQLAAALVTSQLLAAPPARDAREANGDDSPIQDTRTFGSRREAHHGAGHSDAGRQPGDGVAGRSAGGSAAIEESGDATGAG